MMHFSIIRRSKQMADFEHERLLTKGLRSAVSRSSKTSYINSAMVSSSCLVDQKTKGYPFQYCSHVSQVPIICFTKEKN